MKKKFKTPEPELDYRFERWLTVKNRDGKINAKTPESLINKGIYACSYCGKLNPLEAEKCVNCNEEKFVITG